MVRYRRSQNIRPVINYLQAVGYTDKEYGWFYKDPTVRGYRVKLRDANWNGWNTKRREMEKARLRRILDDGGFLGEDGYLVDYMGTSDTKRADVEGWKGHLRAWLCLIVPYCQPDYGG